jgi:hypothetical protein
MHAMSHPAPSEDQRHHLDSLLMREILLDKDVQKSTEVPVFRMLPDTHVIKIGGRSIIDAGRAVTYPVVEALATCLASHKLIIGTGGGARSRHWPDWPVACSRGGALRGIRPLPRHAMLVPAASGLLGRGAHAARGRWQSRLAGQGGQRPGHFQLTGAPLAATTSCGGRKLASGPARRGDAHRWAGAAGLTRPPNAVEATVALSAPPTRLAGP